MKLLGEYEGSRNGLVLWAAGKTFNTEAHLVDDSVAACLDLLSSTKFVFAVHDVQRCEIAADRTLTG